MPWPFDLGTPPPEAPLDIYAEPTRINAGDTLSFRKNFSLYRPGDGWELKYTIRTQNASDPTFTASADGTDFVISVPPSVTRGWTPGNYVVQGYVINGDERHTIYNGLLEVLRDLTTVTSSTDLRTHAQRTLDLIKITLEGRASDDILDSHIENTTFRRLTPDQLLLLKDRYEAEVRKEIAQARVRAGKASGRTILARFGRPV